jgi:DNA-binding response OmpR family regulator
LNERYLGTGPGGGFVARILVIDDNDSFRESLRMFLEAAGHQVLGAADGREGARLVRQHAPDLLLCDIFMPRKDGLEMIRELRHDFPGLRVIVMSGGSDRVGIDLLPVARLMGAVHALQKPFELHDALAAVEQVLRDASPG